MDEKKSYSVDDILNEAGQLHRKRNSLSQKEAIEKKTQEILASLGRTAPQKDEKKVDDELDSWFDSFDSEVEKEMELEYTSPVSLPKDIPEMPKVPQKVKEEDNKNSVSQNKPLPQKQEKKKSVESDFVSALAEERLRRFYEKKNFSSVSKKSPIKEIDEKNNAEVFETNSEISNAVPKRKHGNIDETVKAVSKNPYGNKIDNIVNSSLNGESNIDRKAARRLTRTGVIRKADSLINEDADGIITRLPDVPESGTLNKDEKIVGEKEDIRAKAYNNFIRSKEQKKQDTGIIKTIGIKLPDDAPKTVLPTIDRETGTEKTLVRKTDKKILTNFDHTGNIEGQTRIEGFEGDSVEKITEDELEDQLDKNRQKKLDEFEFEKEYKNKHVQAIETASHGSVSDTYSPKKETPIIDEIVDYNSENDRRAIHIELKNMRSKFHIRSLVTGFIEIVIAIIGLLGSGIMSNFGLGTSGERVYIIINLALLLLMSILSAKAIFKGIVALFTLKPSGDSLVAFAVIVTFVQSILALTLGNVSAGASHIYVAAAGFILLLNSLGKSSMTRRIQRNFSTIHSKNKYTVACVTDEKEAAEMAKGAELEYFDIRYNIKTEFATKFLANSYASDPADDIAKKTTYIAIGASFVLAVISYFISKDFLSAMAVLTSSVLICVPAANVLCFNSALEDANKELSKERGAICGFDAVDDASSTNAVVLSCNELFPKKCCVLKGMKLFSHMQIDDALLYTASVLRETNHPFKDIFLESVEAVNEHIPQASDTTYEARLGISSWIYNRKILLGSEEMMGAHGIEIPMNAHPEEFVHDANRVMFLSIDGVISAMFVLEYKADPTTEYELQRLEASLVEILVETMDSNIDEDFLSYLFRLSDNSVRVMSIVAARMYKEKSEKLVMNEAKIVNTGDPITFMRSITACSMLASQFRILKIIQYVAMALGFAVIAVFSLLNSIATISALHIVIYSLLWAAAVIAIPKIYKSVPKR